MADQSQRKKYYGEYYVMQKNVPVEKKWITVVAKDAKKELDIDSINMWAEQLYIDAIPLLLAEKNYNELIATYSGCLSATDSSGNTITAEKLIEDTINSTDPGNIGGQRISELVSNKPESILSYKDRIKKEAMDQFNKLQDGYNTDAETEVNNVAESDTIREEIANDTEAEGRTDGHLEYYSNGVI